MWRQYTSSTTTYQTTRLRNAEGYPDDTVPEQHLAQLTPCKPANTVASFSPWRHCLILEQLMWDLWWTRLFCSGHFMHTSALASQLSFNQCSIFVFNIFCTDKVYLFLTVYNPTFLWPKGELETFITILWSFTFALWQFVVFYHYPCEGNLMMVATATKTCR